MLETLMQFVFFPVVVAFILGFLYYGLYQLLNPPKLESGRTTPDTAATTTTPTSTTPTSTTPTSSS